MMRKTGRNMNEQNKDIWVDKMDGIEKKDQIIRYRDYAIENLQLALWNLRNCNESQCLQHMNNARAGIDEMKYLRN